MPHPVELIQRITALIQSDYPADQYSFITEKAIPGTRMYPDILVCDQDGNHCCVVEIGYTRPEKLTAYRNDLKIPDVRWYDKAGNLHADVEERVVKVSIETVPIGVFSVYRIDDIVECNSDHCEGSAIEETGEGPLFVGELFEEISEYLCIDTALLCVTDFRCAWFVLFCDKCGETRAVSEDYSVDVEAIADDLRTCSAREFGSIWGKRLNQADWKGVQRFMLEYLNVELRYEDGEFLNPEDKVQMNRSLSTFRLEARLEAG
jgi:hypothetical protein